MTWIIHSYKYTQTQTCTGKQNKIGFKIIVWISSFISHAQMCQVFISNLTLTLKLPDKLQPYGLYVYYEVHICDFGMLRVNSSQTGCGKKHHLPKCKETCSKNTQIKAKQNIRWPKWEKKVSTPLMEFSKKLFL